MLGEAITNFGMLMIPDCSVETLTMELKFKYYLMQKQESLEKTLKFEKKLTEDRVTRWLHKHMLRGTQLLSNSPEEKGCSLCHKTADANEWLHSNN